MKDHKSGQVTRGIVLSAVFVLLLTGAGCVGTTSVGNTPPPPPPENIDAPSTVYCLGSLLSNFIQFKSEDTEQFVSFAIDVLANAFAQSCSQLAGITLDRIGEGLDPNTYVYVSPAQPSLPLIINSPIYLANCTSQPESSDYTINYPFVMDIAPTISNQYDAIYSNDLSLSGMGNTTQQQVAHYLVHRDRLQLGFIQTNITSNRYTVPARPFLQPDEYMTMTPQLTVTSISGTYEVWQHGGIINQAARWSYIQQVQFQTPLAVHFHSGAKANGYCNG